MVGGIDAAEILKEGENCRFVLVHAVLLLFCLLPLPQAGRSTKCCHGLELWYVSLRFTTALHSIGYAQWMLRCCFIPWAHFNRRAGASK